MKRMPYGYTIIEVMMFLLISSALLGSVMTMMSGKQERTRFTQSVESFERKLNDISNDASTGYYPSAEDFNCSYNSGNDISFSGTNNLKGENGGIGTSTGCVFLGKAIEFQSGGTLSKYTVYTIVGSERGQSLDTANPKLLGEGIPGIKEENQLPADLEITKVISLTNSANNVKGAAIISDFAQTSGIEKKITGNANRVTLYEVKDDFAANVGKSDVTKMSVADKGVMLCVQQGGIYGRKGAVTLGAGGGRLSTDIKIDNVPMECN